MRKRKVSASLQFRREDEGAQLAFNAAFPDPEQSGNAVDGDALAKVADQFEAMLKEASCFACSVLRRH